MSKTKYPRPPALQECGAGNCRAKHPGERRRKAKNDDRGGPLCLAELGEGFEDAAVDGIAGLAAFHTVALGVVLVPVVLVLCEEPVELFCSLREEAVVSPVWEGVGFCWCYEYCGEEE